MSEKNITQYKLINEYGINEAQLFRLRKNMVVKTSTLDKLCDILQCNVEDICEHIPKDL